MLAWSQFLFNRLKVRYSTQLLLAASLVLLTLSPLCVCRQFYIAPSPDLCPGGQAQATNGGCLTIEQFASSANLSLAGSPYVTLELVAGDHTLESELYIAEDVSNFVMRSTNASILCSGSNASITFKQVINIHISSVKATSHTTMPSKVACLIWRVLT